MRKCTKYFFFQFLDILFSFTCLILLCSSCVMCDSTIYKKDFGDALLYFENVWTPHTSHNNGPTTTMIVECCFSFLQKKCTYDCLVLL